MHVEVPVKAGGGQHISDHGQWRGQPQQAAEQPGPARGSDKYGEPTGVGVADR